MGPVERLPRVRTRSTSIAIEGEENTATGKRLRVKAEALSTRGAIKKRPALADVTNALSQRPQTRGISKVRKEVTAEQPVLLNRDVHLREPAREPVGTGPAYELPSIERGEGLSQFSATVVAALERSTKQSLVISSGGAGSVKCRPRSRDEEVDPCKRLGWSQTILYKDIDAEVKDPQMCAAYVTDIYEHLREAELKRRPATNYMETVQHDINASMRGILIDWLVEVAEEYRLVPDSLYLTVSYIDRYLSRNPVPRSKLQLVGVTAMLIASKYEELYPPQVDEFCYITDNTYNRAELLLMERHMLNTLHFELSNPSTKSFLRRFLRAAQANVQLEFLANFLAELSLLEYSFLKYLPSVVAASSVFIAKYTLQPEKSPWTLTLQHYTGYKPSDLRECAEALHQLQLNTKGCNLPATREKYRSTKYKCVAAIPPPEWLPLDLFNDAVPLDLL
ncbi:G2/Mitotic-specific cyclin A [Klebsormidium nitens]|uniref:G2/Mitotic-specific cyclin A n=1 Tax=Klebsormidium nitens TaxID=105231 RepID=A0A1Y1HWC3_KLENI|nr:G2/Mitotic-specific cyclin A [Klebsormidium nitens]|eukprot:GAQ82463.1 G2/Mitotic-specific cyclin A [Klebsormidium nitens]